MSTRLKSVLSVLLALFAIGILCWIAFVGIRSVWRNLVDVNPSLAVALIAAASTLIAATVTVMLGRYFERKRDIEAHFRGDKIKLYDDFLRDMFAVLHADGTMQDAKLVKVLREWQRKLVLWGGQDVLLAYFKWVNHLKLGNPNADTIFLMDDFFSSSAVGHRSELQRSSSGFFRKSSDASRRFLP